MSHTETDTPEALAEMLTSRRRRWIAPVAVVMMLLAGAALYAVGAMPKREARQEASDRANERQNAVRRVQVATVRSADETLTIRQPATLEPLRRAQMLAQVGGYLVERRVDVGARVEAGQVLAVIATPMLEKELVEAEAAREAARAELAEARQGLELAERTSSRISLANQSRSVAQQQVDDAQTQVRRDLASVQRAEAAVQVVEAQIQRLRRLLEFRELKAPFAGVVSRRTREQGDYIEVGGNITDPPVFTIVDASSLRTVVSVPQAQAYLVRAGQDAVVRVAGLRDLSVRGTITRVSGELDQASRTMPIEVEVSNADGRLIAGSFATVEITVTRPPEQRPAVIPGNALMLLPNTPGGGGPTVPVLTGDGPTYTLTYRSVRLGRDFGNEVEVLDGLQPGERVAMNIPVPLPENTRVEPFVPANSAASGPSGAPAVGSPPAATGVPGPSAPARGG